MEIRPILSAMRRNKVGAILIAVQMAITLAILCNALFIIEQRVTSSRRPSGADEANVIIISNQWVGNPPDISARLQGDLAALAVAARRRGCLRQQFLSLERWRIDHRRQSESGPANADGIGCPVLCGRTYAAGTGT